MESGKKGSLFTYYEFSIQNFAAFRQGLFTQKAWNLTYRNRGRRCPQTNKLGPRFLREHFSLILSFATEISYVSIARFLSAKCFKYFEDLAKI